MVNYLFQVKTESRDQKLEMQRSVIEKETIEAALRAQLADSQAELAALAQ